MLITLNDNASIALKIDLVWFFILMKGKGGKKNAKNGQKKPPKKIRRENKYKASLFIYH